MTQEEVFSVLGFTADCDPSLDDEPLKKAAFSGQSRATEDISDCGNLPLDCIDNISKSEVTVGSDKDGPSTMGVDDVNCVSDVNASTSDSANVSVHKVDDVNNEKSGELDNKTDKEADTLLDHDNPSALDNKMESGNDIEEVVVLDDTDNKEENVDAQTSCGEKGGESKIGKISIKKFEDLCEVNAEKKKEGDSKVKKEGEKKKSSSSDESKSIVNYVFVLRLNLIIVYLYLTLPNNYS